MEDPNLGWAARPAGVTWPALGLAGDLLVAAKIGIIIRSFASALAGMVVLSKVTN
ncbi:MAG: hypothetical protein OES69_01350 [Myxococcales bacterium]|nr:hypothetical protein [Myxococcales bacterium]MDH3842555.1 hypothetical protein [Myxococcales bacterium]